MTAREIVDKIHKDRATINPYYDNRCWFEMYVCEIRGDEGARYSSKAVFKYNKLNVKDNKILLCNKRGKVIKELSKENIDWIQAVYLCDRHIKVLISDLNFVEIENFCPLKEG